VCGKISTVSDLSFNKNKIKGKIIAIDGPAGSGKSTTAKILAEKLGFVYLDTGAMYRALTYLSQKEKVAARDGIKLAQLAREMPLKFDPSTGENRVFIGIENITKKIRTPEITRVVSEISAHADVRRAMVEKQKSIGKNGSIVAEGRDTTTVVFPDADVKIYMDATVKERARRRALDMQRLGINTNQDEQEKEIIRRDKLDTERKHSPLTKANDAVVVDTTNITIEEQVRKILELLINLVNGK
jgi:cytidylate kinase